MAERLDKIVSSIAGVSRKEARSVVLRGRVTVNGKRICNISEKVNPETDEILIDGKNSQYKKYIYIMLNKPKGLLSASNDKSRQTVVDLVKPSFPREGMFPVGRLDKDTTGFLIITDDGEFGHKVISPKSKIEKEYIVGLDKPITENNVKILESGVTLQDGTLCRPAKVRILDNCLISMTITEGKYHEIKRMLGVVDIGVISLKRIRIGNLTLDESLNEGEFRDLTQEELINIWN